MSILRSIVTDNKQFSTYVVYIGSIALTLHSYTYICSYLMVDTSQYVIIYGKQKQTLSRLHIETYVNKLALVRIFLKMVRDLGMPKKQVASALSTFTHHISLRISIPTSLAERS